MVTALILLSALLHASWNAFVKSDRDRTVSLAWIVGFGGVLGLLALPFVSFPKPEVWPYLIATTVLQNGYFAFVLLSYKHADLSQAYPIARGSAALLAALASAALGLDALTPREWLGIVVSSFGIASLAFAASGSGLAILRGIGYPILSGAFTASYSIVDGMGARAAGSAFEYIVWLNVVASPFFPLYVMLRRRPAVASSPGLSTGARFAAAVIATASYGIAVWAFTVGSMGRAAVLRETSVLFGAILGSMALKEPFGGRRILSAALILLGFLIWPY